MTTQTLQSQLQTEQIPGEEPFRRGIQAAQVDIVNLGFTVMRPQSADFPNVPTGGAMLVTSKGLYEGIFTDADPAIPQWRRLNNNAIFSVGSTIPTTL